MKVIRYRKDKVEHYFDYNSIISIIKEHKRATFNICSKDFVDGKEEVLFHRINITAETLLMDDRFEILYFPFTEKEYIRLSSETKDYELSKKIIECLLELKMAEHKMGKRM